METGRSKQRRRAAPPSLRLKGGEKNLFCTQRNRELDGEKRVGVLRVDKEGGKKERGSRRSPSRPRSPSVSDGEQKRAGSAVSFRKGHSVTVGHPKPPEGEEGGPVT